MELLVMRNPIQLYSRKTYQITFVAFNSVVLHARGTAVRKQTGLR